MDQPSQPVVPRLGVGRVDYLLGGILPLVHLRSRVHYVSSNQPPAVVDDLVLSVDEFVQLASLAASSGNPAAPSLLRRLARRYKTVNERAAHELIAILRAGPVRASGITIADPVDTDSRLPLLRREDPVILQTTPIFDPAHLEKIDQIVHEHQRSEALYARGLAPTRSALFVGPPGVGKTLAARWIAHRLDMPLLTLDLSSVMSSFLGRTGGNIRRVVDHARQTRCVLLLDELDAVAKRRDDATEIGELKRLVTVLLQEIDQWPEGSLLLAATNHGELLDPAVWRRFEIVLDFPLPTAAARTQALHQLLGGDTLETSVIDAVVATTARDSLSNLESLVLAARRRAAIGSTSLPEALIEAQRGRIGRMTQTERMTLAVQVLSSGALSQRQVSRLTGVSRDTLRKHTEQV